MAKPFLRWAGSKRQLVKSLAKYWTGESARYVEPFVGSARLFFEIEPNSALLGDINSDLVSMYEVVRTHPSEIHHSLSHWSNNKDEYYRVRNLDPMTLDNIDRAARFIYLNRFCFNGLYRTNKAGNFNVPYGGRKSGAIPTEKELNDAGNLLTRVNFICGDFTQTLKSVKHGDFVYLDPPFTTAETRVFVEYGPSSFGQKDLVRLRKSLEELNDVGVTFLLSYAECPEGRMLAHNFRTSEVKAKRHIAGFANSRREAVELLISNAKC